MIDNMIEVNEKDLSIMDKFFLYCIQENINPLNLYNTISTLRVGNPDNRSLLTEAEAIKIEGITNTLKLKFGAQVDESLIDKIDFKLRTEAYYTNCWEEFKSVYPKKENKRLLHDKVRKAKAKYVKLLRDDDIDHEEAVYITKKYVVYKENMDAMYKKTKDRNYWIEAYQLLSVFVNNLPDQLQRYRNLDSSEISVNEEFEETSFNIINSEGIDLRQFNVEEDE